MIRPILTALACATLVSVFPGCNEDDRAAPGAVSARSGTSTALGEIPEGYGRVSRHLVAIATGPRNPVVVVEIPTLATVDAIENSTNVTAVTRMSDVKASGAEADVPRPSPDGRTLLFQLRDADGDLNLWTMASSNGGDQVRITEGAHLAFAGAWSTKGDRILFSSNRTDAHPHLWELNAFGGGGGLLRLTDSPEADVWAHEAASGGIIAFTRVQSGASTIWTYDRKTALSTQLLAGRQPQISPDGRQIVYSAYDEQEGHWNIWLMGIDGSHPTQLTHNDADNITPAWHPASTWIIFASNKGAVTGRSRETGAPGIQVHNFDIWMMKADGEHMSQLTVNGSDDDNPAFGPDGATFWFSSNRGHALEDLARIGSGRDIWRATITEDVMRDEGGPSGGAKR